LWGKGRGVLLCVAVVAKFVGMRRRVETDEIRRRMKSKEVKTDEMRGWGYFTS
jgi:hypothetical protein